MKTIFLVRHGVTQANLDVVYAGRTDDRLLASADEQLEAVAAHLRSCDVQWVFVSPQRRAIHSAEVVARNLAIQSEVCDDLAEMEMGRWTGLDAEAISQRFPEEWRKWRDDPWNAEWDGFEGLRGIEVRARRWLDSLIGDTSPGNVVAFTHETVIKVLIAVALGAQGQLYRQLIVPNASVSSLVLEDGAWKLNSLNEYIQR